MAGKPKNDLLGKIYGDLTVTQYVGKGRWICTCKCGNTREVRAWDLENNRAKRCLECSSNHKTSDEVYVGKRFGEWEVLERIDKGWLCRCSCGTERTLSSYQLTSGRSKSCGHNTANIKDITGQKFGELTVLNHEGSGYWKCRCSCGNTVIVLGRMLRCGNTSSCGCKRGRDEINIAGKQFGEWRVLEYLGNSYWKCKCSCGKISNVHSYSLRTGKSLNCGAPIHRLNNLVGKRFGKLTVKSWNGDGFYTCECDCGNTKIIRAANLVNGSTNSCGCETDRLLRNTLLQKYHETTPSKVSNPRDLEQIYKLYNESELLNILIKFNTLHGRKPYLKEIAIDLGVTTPTLLKYIREYKLENCIEIQNTVSSYEYELRELFPGFVASDKKILGGLELDLYYPEKKLALEFNGNYWHSTVFKNSTYHQDKTIQCAKKGIRIIHIFEYEWLNETTKAKLIEFLGNIINTENNVIYARNTEIVEIDTEKAKEFLELYHLQGAANASIRYGLYNKENRELLGVMAFGKPRFNSSYEYELIRLCWKTGIHVVGGVEKLFKHFIEQHNTNSIVSYCDIAKFSGEVYQRLGFKTSLESITKPNYVWIKPSNNEVLTRYQTMKHLLIKNNLGTQEQTEDEIMEDLGYLKIYDCGNLRFTWNKNI